jgi:hypothetical protein
MILKNWPNDVRRRCTLALKGMKKSIVIKDDVMISRTSLKRLDILGMIVKAFKILKTLGNFVQVVALFGYSIVIGDYDHSIFVLVLFVVCSFIWISNRCYRWLH